MSDPPEASPVAEPQPWRPGFRSTLLLAAWFGLVSGDLELAAFLAKCNLLDPRNYNVSHHFPWMFPLAGVALMAGPGLLMALLTVPSRRRIPPGLVVFALAAPAALGFLFRWPIYTAACLLLAVAVGSWAGRFATRHPVRSGRIVAVSYPVLLVLFASSVALCTWGDTLRIGWRREPGQPVPVPGGPRNAILIVLDTVRARSLGLYGYSRDTAPNLARLAARGVRFDQAYATAPWTAPSHASMFTGRWPHEAKIDWNRPLDPVLPTLAWFLGNKGFDTAGFVANVTYCSHETGLSRGFGHYEDYPLTPRAVMMCSATVARAMDFLHRHPAIARRLGLPEKSSGDRKDAARINADFLRWLDGRPRGPFFAFLNYFDAHHPYFPPEGAEVAIPGRAPQTPDEIRLIKTWWETDKRSLTPPDVELARDAYDRCIAALDAQVGRLLDELDRRGLAEETLIIVTSDHGEHLGEHGLFGHGVSLYRPEVHVPLVVAGPGVPKGMVVDTPVSLRELPTTYVESLLANRSTPFPGESLARFWTTPPGGNADPSRLVLSEVVAPPEDDPNHGRSPARRGPLRSIADRGHRYIRDRDGREQLFDLARDPDEAHDLAASPDSAPLLERFRGLLPP